MDIKTVIKAESMGFTKAIRAVKDEKDRKEKVKLLQEQIAQKVEQNREKIIELVDNHSEVTWNEGCMFFRLDKLGKKYNFTARWNTSNIFCVDFEKNGEANVRYLHSPSAERLELILQGIR